MHQRAIPACSLSSCYLRDAPTTDVDPVSRNVRTNELYSYLETFHKVILFSALFMESVLQVYSGVNVPCSCGGCERGTIVNQPSKPEIHDAT